MRKTITSVALCGDPVLFFDNCKGRLGGPALEAGLTAEQWKDRILGINKMVTVPLTHTTVATGNNATLTTDMIGHTVHSRLQCDENPDLRSGFVHPDLLAYAKENQKALALAALSIVYHYWKAGKKDMGLSAWGGFQVWSDLVRNAIVWAGLPDPDTRSLMRDECDDGTALLRAIVLGWEAFDKPVTIAEAFSTAHSDEDKYPRSAPQLANWKATPRRR